MTKIWGHRGASGYAPENTLPAYELAAKMGADGIELDVQKTKDGQLVVCHDETIDRTSDHKGLVRDYTLSELKAMTFSKTHPEYGDVKIPTLAEVLDYVKNSTSMTINIELKTGIIFYENIEAETVKMVHDFSMQERIIYSSFNHYSVKKIQQIDPEAEVGLLYEDEFIDVPRYGHEMGVSALHPWEFCMQVPDYLEECRKYGLKLHVWTVNREESMRRLCQDGVDAIITNFPDKALAVRSQVQNRGPAADVQQ